MTVQWQADMFKAPEQSKKEARAQAKGGEDLWICEYALPAIRKALSERTRITVDDVWDMIPDIAPFEPRRMGPAMMQARKLGIIRPTDEVRRTKSKRQNGHYVRVWTG